MPLPANLDQLNADELRRLLVEQDRELNWRQVKIDKLTHEVAYYKRHYFGVKAERLPVEQRELFEETLAADMAAITEQVDEMTHDFEVEMATDEGDIREGNASIARQRRDVHSGMLA